MELKFVTQETVVQPVGGLILEDLAPEDHILGAFDPKGMGKVVLEDGHWAPFLPKVIEIQRVKDGDTYGCTCFSDDEIDETICMCKYGTELNISDKFVTVASGTQRGVGNSMKAAPELKRKKGFALESEYPYSREETLDQFYAPVPQAIFAKAEEKLKQYDTGYLAVGGTGQSTILDALKVSPLKIAIEGRYVFDENNRLKFTNSGYTHAVMLFDYVLDENGSVVEWWIRCSETSQFLKMRSDYAFVSPMVKFFEKKSPMNKYKIKGKSAVFQLDPVDHNLYPHGSGFVYKLVNGVVDYKDVQEVENLAALEAIAPLGDRIITDLPWDKSSFINSLT